MAVEGGAGARERRKRSTRPRVRYFFLNDELHRVLSINRPQDLIVAWNYPQHKRVGYVWSDCRRRMGKAYTMQEVSKLINRHRVHIEKYIIEGKIRTPQRIYTLDGTEKPGKYFFSQEDIYGLHDYLLTVHIGRPRKDGRVTPGRMPSRAELRAMMEHNVIMYIKNEDTGEFTPVWKEIDW